MIPLSLRLSGFISYLDPVELDFQGFDVACISGSNGAGKSSLLDAITWALFGVARKRDDSLIHSKANTAEITFDFKYEGNTYRIQRSKTRDKPVSLEFLILQAGVADEPGDWKPFTEKGTRETEAAIQQTLHMDFDTFTNASFFLQGKADLFAQQRPADRKRILSSILGLDIWDQYRDRSSEWRKSHEDNLNRMDGLIQEINTELAEEPERLKRLEELEGELARLVSLLKLQSAVVENLRQLDAQLKEQQKLATALSGQRNATREKVEQLTSLIAQRVEEQTHLQKLVVEASRIDGAHQAYQDAVEKLGNFEAQAAQFRDIQERRTNPWMSIESERVRLESERQQLESIKAVILEADQELARLVAKDKSISNAIKDADAEILKRTSLETDLNQKERERAELQADNVRYRSSMQELDERIKNLEPVEGSECPTCGQPLSPTDRQKLITSLKKEGKKLGDTYRRNQKDLNEIGESIRGLELALGSLTSLDAILREATRAHDQHEARKEQVRQQISEWATTGAPHLMELEAILRKNTYALEARKELLAIDQEAKSLGYDASAHDATRKYLQDGKIGEEEFKELANARSALVPLEREIDGYHDQLLKEQSNLKQLEEDAAQAEARQVEALVRQPDVEKGYSEMLDLQERERQQHMDVGAARQKVAVLDTLRARLSSLNLERESTTNRISELRTLERAFGKDGVPALLIEQALPEIEAQANRLLDQLSDGNMSVRFSTLRDYKDKNRDDKRETLDIIISDANGTRDYEMYSGGEAFRIDFAIRLALSRVLAQRAGARLQTLVIDEGFGSQDASGRQRLIEAINIIRPDFEKILVITHMDEIKDAFPTRIEITKTPRGSTITLT
jgi:exonuclease SbcC